MSYLDALRLHFAGRFQANVSTVNNDPGHFDNAIFQPSYQAMQGPNFNPPNGWFNPQGDAAWRLLGCSVTSAWTPGGAVSSGDPILRCIVADSDSQAPAKLVDLDPEQQLVSEIWGLQVRIADADGNTLLCADYDPAAFIDIWDRATVSSAGDADAGAAYQSVLSNLRWSDVSGSPFLSALKAAAANGLLSIKFNVDSFNLDFTSPDFMTGRIVGTIGPAAADEPKHLVLGRQFMAASAKPPGNFFLPAGGINFCVARVDAAAGLVYLDLGNALQTGTGDALLDIGDLALGIYDPLLTPTDPAGSITPIGAVLAHGVDGYTAPDWYARTAGVVVLPVPHALLPIVQTSPMLLFSSKGRSISEASSGAFVRADTFVYRMSPGDSADIALYATRFGQPLAGVELAFTVDNSQLQAQVGDGPPFVTPSPPVGTPAGVLGYAATQSTDHGGRALFSVAASDPGMPRQFNVTLSNPAGDYGIDGQVYGLRPGFVDTTRYDTGPINQWNFVSFLVWSGFTTKVPRRPTWYDDLQPIFQQYANLYPVMNRFLDLADYDSVVRNARLLILAFGLDAADPNTMPVTRDLSPAKRSAILNWLQNGMPRGTPPATKAVARAPAPVAATEAAPVAQRGGKAMAAARRLVLQATVKEPTP